MESEIEDFKRDIPMFNMAVPEQRDQAQSMEQRLRMNEARVVELDSKENSLGKQLADLEADRKSVADRLTNLQDQYTAASTNVSRISNTVSAASEACGILLRRWIQNATPVNDLVEPVGGAT